ncbi:MAG TPA: hypothetical protein VMV53_00620 [Acidimicrobiales bacterium]|nr:hypothetical protein [Acidimicrobiales bacterium]
MRGNAAHWGVVRWRQGDRAGGDEHAGWLDVLEWHQRIGATRQRESRHPRTRAHSLAGDALTASTRYPLPAVPRVRRSGTPARAINHRRAAARGGCQRVGARESRRIERQHNADLWDARPRRLSFEVMEP